MKKILCSIAAIAATLFLGLSLSAQEKAPYVTSLGGENWFIGIGGGLNTNYDNGKFSVKPFSIAVDANVGKWFTPSWGARVGYHGFQAHAADPTNWFSGTDKFLYHFAHVDGLWNISNAIGGYKETRFWEFVPFLQAGVVIGSTAKSTVSNIALGAGIMNKLRLGEKVNLTLEVGSVVAPEQAFRNGSGRFTFFPSATLGLMFNLGKSDFEVYRPAPIVDLPDYNGIIAKLKNEIAVTADKLTGANNTIAALKDKLAAYNLVDGKTYDYKDGKFTEAAPKTEAQPEIFYFDVSKTTLSERELARLEFYAKNTFKKDQKLLITGGADAGTGSAAINAKLSKQRAEYVKNLLVNTYGFNPANLETEAEVLGTDSPIKGRIVTIRVK